MSDLLDMLAERRRQAERAIVENRSGDQQWVNSAMDAELAEDALHAALDALAAHWRQEP